MKLPLIFLPLLLAFSLQAQRDTLDPHTESVYYTKWYVSGGIAAVGALTNNLAIERTRDKDFLTPEQLAALSEEDVPGIDRIALRQDVSRSERSERGSDYIFQVSAILPFTLFIDKKFRKDWLDLSLIYLETQMLAANFYGYAPPGPGFSNRLRPVAYYENFSYDVRANGNVKNSMFSGHVSSTATGTFTFAKFLSDYNPQWTGWQRALCFGLAAVPPSVVGVQRVRALKHFPTDNVVGIVVGAFFGTMTPHFHKRWAARHRSRLSLGGSYGSGTGGTGFLLTF